MGLASGIGSGMTINGVHYCHLSISSSSRIPLSGIVVISGIIGTGYTVGDTGQKPWSSLLFTESWV